jgi:hypothetical protein
VGQVRTRPLSAPARDAPDVSGGRRGDSPFSGFVSVSQVRGALCTNATRSHARFTDCPDRLIASPVRAAASRRGLPLPASSALPIASVSGTALTWSAGSTERIGDQVVARAGRNGITLSAAVDFTPPRRLPARFS